MAAHRSPNQLAELSDFIQRLYELGGYATWKEFADDANLSAPQLSDFQQGKVEPAGYNLLKLMQAASRRGEADASQVARLSATQPFLEALQNDVAALLLGQAEILERIDQVRQSERPAQKPAAPKRKAATRRSRPA